MTQIETSAPEAKRGIAPRGLGLLTLLCLIGASSARALTLSGVTLSNASANAVGQVDVQMDTTTLLKAGETITLVFPSNTLIPNSISAAAVTLQEQGGGGT